MSFDKDDIVQINSTNGGMPTFTTVVVVYANNEEKTFTCTTLKQKGYDSDGSSPWTFAWDSDTFATEKIGDRSTNPEYFL